MALSWPMGRRPSERSSSVPQIISKMLVVPRLASRMVNASNGLLYDDQSAIAGPVEGA